MHLAHHHKHNCLIQEAKARIPKGLHKYLDCDILVGYDPLSVNLHSYQFTFDGRSYSTTAHVVFPEHATDKRITIVIPELDFCLENMVHEFAHVLDYNTWNVGPSFIYHTTEYSKSNFLECFAERFTTMIFPQYCPDYEPDREEEFLEFINKLQKY